MNNAHFIYIFDYNTDLKVSLTFTHQREFSLLWNIHEFFPFQIDCAHNKTAM